MPVRKSYCCRVHGYYDAWSDNNACPVPECEEAPMQVLLKPVAIRTNTRTKSIDATMSRLAADYGMTNIKSTREGEAQTGYLTRNNAPPEASEPRPGDAVMWGGVGKYTLDSVTKGNAIRPVKNEQVGISVRDANMPRQIPTVVHASDPTPLKV